MSSLSIDYVIGFILIIKWVCVTVLYLRFREEEEESVKSDKINVEGCGLKFQNQAERGWECVNINQYV